MRKLTLILEALMVIALAGCGTLGGLLGDIGDSGNSASKTAVPAKDRLASLDEYGAAMIATTRNYVAQGTLVEARFLEQDLEAAQLSDAQQKELADLQSQTDATWKPDAESSTYNTDVLVPAKDYTGKYGYIDQSGAFEIPARYTKADEFSEGLALVEEEKGQPKYFIDRTGAKVLEIKPSIERYFYDQEKKTVWMVRDSKDSLEVYDGSYPIALDKISIEAMGGFHNGLARCEIRTYKIEMKGAYTMGRQGTIYIDRTGKERLFFPSDMWWISDVDYQCRDFSGGRALVLRVKGNERLFGYVDATGKWLVEPSFNSAGSYSDGMAAAMFPNTDRSRESAPPGVSARFDPPRRAGIGLLREVELQ